MIESWKQDQGNEGWIVDLQHKWKYIKIKLQLQVQFNTISTSIFDREDRDPKRGSELMHTIGLHANQWTEKATVHYKDKTLQFPLSLSLSSIHSSAVESVAEAPVQ